MTPFSFRAAFAFTGSPQKSKFLEFGAPNAAGERAGAALCEGCATTSLLT